MSALPDMWRTGLCVGTPCLSPTNKLCSRTYNARIYIVNILAPNKFSSTLATIIIFCHNNSSTNEQYIWLLIKNDKQYIYTHERTFIVLFFLKFLFHVVCWMLCCRAQRMQQSANNKLWLDFSFKNLDPDINRILGNLCLIKGASAIWHYRLKMLYCKKGRS